MIFFNVSRMCAGKKFFVFVDKLRGSDLSNARSAAGNLAVLQNCSNKAEYI